LSEEDDDPILMRHRSNRNRILDSSEANTDTTTIKKLHVSFPNLQKVPVN